MSGLGFISTPMQKPKKCTIEQLANGTCFDEDPASRRVRVDAVRPCPNNEKKCYKIVLSVRGRRRRPVDENLVEDVDDAVAYAD